MSAERVKFWSSVVTDLVNRFAHLLKTLGV